MVQVFVCLWYPWAPTAHLTRGAKGRLPPHERWPSDVRELSLLPSFPPSHPFCPSFTKSQSLFMMVLAYAMLSFANTLHLWSNSKVVSQRLRCHQLVTVFGAMLKSIEEGGTCLENWVTGIMLLGTTSCLFVCFLTMRWRDMPPMPSFQLSSITPRPQSQLPMDWQLQSCEIGKVP